MQQNQCQNPQDCLIKKNWGFWQQGTCKKITLLENIVTITSYTPVLKIKTSNPCATKKIKPAVNN